MSTFSVCVHSKCVYLLCEIIWWFPLTFTVSVSNKRVFYGMIMFTTVIQTSCITIAYEQHLLIPCVHDDVIKWIHFPRYWPFERGIHRSPVNSPHKGQWRGALMFSLICAWLNTWVNNREAGDLRRNRTHYDVMKTSCITIVYEQHLLMPCITSDISIF